MSNKTKVWIIVAIFLIFTGYIVFCVAMNKLNWDFTKLSTNKLETNKYEINNNFKDIKIITDTADIIFVTSEESNSLVVCDEQENVKHLVKVKDNTLLIEVDDNRKWYEHIGINFVTPKITIYLPENEYGELLIESSTGDINVPEKFKFKSVDILEDTGDIENYASVYEDIRIRTSTGDIHTENIIANRIDLATSTGKIEVINTNCIDNIKIKVSTGKTNIIDTNCKNLLSNGSTGNIYLENVIVTEKISIKRSTGDVKFKDSDANDIFIKTDTGNVIGSFLTNKVFFVETDTGSIDVPKTIADEKCEVITNTGDIKITVK